MERFCARCGQRGQTGMVCARDGTPLALVEGLLGRAAGNYTLVQQIGQGGMGEVFRAINPQLEAEVAIKVLHAQPTKGASSDSGQRFLTEARAVNRVKHDGVVRIADGGYIDVGRPYLVMDLLEGESLSEALARAPRLPRALRILDDVLDIVSAAHAVGIVHRDLKPANVFLTRSARTLVLDFGVAKLLDGSGSVTRTGSMVGTPAYMAPEQVHGTSVDGRTDLYAIGVMLYELLVGVRPFVAATPFATVQAHVQQPIPRLPPVFPQVVQEVVDLALAKEPLRRFQSADEMRAHLHRAMEAVAAMPEFAAMVDGPWPIARASRPSMPPPPTEPQTSPPTMPDRRAPKISGPSAITHGQPSPTGEPSGASFGPTQRERPSSRAPFDPASATAAESPRAQRASMPPDLTARETPYALSGAPDSRLASAPKKRWWIPVAGLVVAGGIAAAIAIGAGGSSSDDVVATGPGSTGEGRAGSGSAGLFVDTLDDIATTPTQLDAGASEPTPPSIDPASSSVATTSDGGTKIEPASSSVATTSEGGTKTDPTPDVTKTGSGTTGSKMIGSTTDATKTDSNATGSKTNGSKTDATKTGSKTNGSKTDATNATGSKTDATKGTKTDAPTTTTVKTDVKPFTTGGTAPTAKYTEAEVIARKNELNALMGKLGFGVDDVGVVIIASYQKALGEKDYSKAMFVLEQVEGIAMSIKVDKVFVAKKYKDNKARYDQLVARGKTVPESVKTDMASGLAQYNEGNYAAANQTLYRAYVTMRKLK